MSNIATFIKEVGGMGQKELFQVDPPMTDWDGNQYSHVLVSGVYALMSGPETYIFPADADGHIQEWGELEGSFRGAIDIDAALEGAGYTVQRSAE